VQVEWVDARPVAGAPVVNQPTRPVIADYRRAPQPAALLEQLRSQPGVQVWCEGEARRRLGGQDRNELAPADTIIIWTIPPGRAELRTALDRSKPKEVVLFADDPGMDPLDAFLQRLAGLAKHALRTEDGLVSVQRLAAATAQRTALVRLGLRWLASRGHVRIQAEEGDAVWLKAGDGSSSAELATMTAQLRELLAETAAFRRYFVQADAEVLLE
jgi:hypothetical protein